MMYVGDNLNKDFQAPKQLGMQWLWVDNGQGLYKMLDGGLPILSLLEVIRN